MKIFSRLKAVALAICVVTSVVRAASPVALPDSYAVNEDTTLSISAPGVLANDSDADGDSFTASLIATTTNGTLTLNANGSFTYRSVSNFFGTDTFTYRARQSASLQSATVAVTIAISPVNDAPRATNNSYSVGSDSVLNIAAPGVLGNDFDVEGDSMTALLAANPAQGSLALNADGSFSYTPNANYFGSDSFTYRALDAQATSTVATVSLTVQPAPIVVTTPPQSQTNCPGGTASFSVTATGTALRYQWLKGTTTLTGQTNSTLVLPNLVSGDAGTFNVRIIGATNSITNSATLTIAAPVMATGLTNFTRFVGSIAIYNTRVTAGTGPIIFAWLKNGAVLPSQSSSNLVLTNLTVEDSGLYSVVVSGACGSVTNSASLNVATCFPSVDVMLVIDRSGSMAGQPYTDARTACTNFVHNLQFGLTNDMCGLVAYNTSSILQQRLTNSMSALELAIHTLPHATNGTRISDGLTNAIAELFSVRHRSNALPIIVLMSDGLPNSGDSATDVLLNAQFAKNAGARIFTVGLGAVDPSLMANAASSTNDYFFTTNSSQLAAFFDAIATIICRPPTNIVAPSDVTVCAGVNASFNVTASGCDGFKFQWRRDGTNLAGQTNTTFTITNAQPLNAGLYSVVVSASCRTVTNFVTLTVNAPAQITASPASQVSFRASNAVFSVTATGTALSYEWSRQGGSTVLSTSDTLTLNNLTTNDAGSYCVFVTGALCGSTVSNCVTLTISNRAPVAVNDSYTINEDTALVIALPGVLTNDFDADGDPLTSIIVVPPTRGTLTLNTNGGFIYTPDNNFNGSDSFTYRATDGASNSNPATVTISVTPVNDLPVANNDAYSMTAGTLLNIAAPGVLANDTDVENTGLTALLASQPANGTLTLNGNGSFTYQPNTNFSGSDSFTYRAFDGSATSGVAIATITVVPVPVFIVVPPTSGTNCPGGTTTFNVTATGTALTYQWTFNGAVIPGVTNRSLAVRNINATNAGIYCVLVNGAAGGPITSCAELTVFETTVVTVPPTNLVVCEGTTAQFTVGATGTQLGYQWSFAGTTITNATNSTLVLTNVPLNAAGPYTVVVNGACGTPVTNTATLVVNDTVEIISAPTNQTSFVGSNVVFTVGAIGTGVIYEWYFNNALISTNSTLPLNNLATNQAGLYCVVVRGVCGAPLTNCTTLTIQNRAPFAANDSYTTLEDQPLIINAPGVLVNDGDIDGDTLTALLVSNPASGTLTFNAVGSFSFTPSLNVTGTVTFTYRVSDAQLTSAPATVTITVTPINDAPVAQNDSYSINEDTTLTVPAAGVLTNDSDVDGDSLSAVLVSNSASGALNLNPNGSFTFTPSLNFTGAVTFTYRAHDSELSSGVATVTIMVLPVNDTPVALNDAYTINEDTVLSVTRPGILANDTDADGNTLTAVLVADVAHGALSFNPNGSFFYSPNANYHGTDTFTYRATDGALTSAVATVTITINPTNDLPVAINDAYTTLEDTALTILPRGILTNDLDVDGDTLTALLVSTTTHGTLSLSNNGAFFYTPSLNYTGVDVFTYRATDGFLTSSVATVTITVSPVNDAPVALNDSYSVNEDTQLVIAAPGVLTNDSDVDGNPLTTVPVSNPASGSLNLRTNGSFTYTPSLNFTGTVTFTYRATDSALTSGVATVTITVLPVNDAPVALDDSYSVNEDTTLTIAAPGLLANDSDVDGNPLTAVLVSNPASGTLNLNTNGAFTFTPSLNFTGAVTFTYRANDSELSSGLATVTITVLPVNDAPVALNDSYSTPEDTALFVPINGVLANDSDVDDDTLTSILITPPASGSLVLSNNGSFLYTPSLNFTGAVTFTYRATDSQLTSGVATVTITVTPVNDAPVANNDSYSMNEDTTLTNAAPGLLANDSDVDGNPLTAVLVSSPASGTLNLNPNGSFTYTPSLNFTGTVTFTYRASDSQLTSGLATVTIMVRPVNDTPVAQNDSYSVNEDTTLIVYNPGLLANDSDVDGDALSSVLATGVAHGTLTLSNNGAFFYTPSLNYTGVDTFTYRATDGALTSSVATVTITVRPVNDVPVAVNDAYTVAEDTTLSIPATGVLANDTDVDSAPLVAYLLADVQHGTLYLMDDGAFTYRPATNYTGTDSFRYYASDGSFLSEEATVTITITPVNDTPVALDDFYSVNEDTPLLIPAPGILGNDSDVDGNVLSAVLLTNVLHGTLTLSNNGAFLYTPSLNYTGADVFAYRATDGALTSSVAYVVITVLPVNDGPVAVNDAYSIAEDNALTIPARGILTNDFDVDGDLLSAVLATGVQHGTLNLATNGGFTYTPSLNYTGVDSFTYRATDGVLTSALATVTITITPVNDAPVANDDASTINEGDTLGLAEGFILQNDSDADGDQLRVVLVSGVQHGSLSTLTTTNGSVWFIYTPSLNYNGVDTFTYRATDGVLTSAVATVTITVLPLNDEPEGVEDSYTTLEDTVLTISAPGVLANDFDVDGDPLTAQIVVNPTHGTVTLSTNGAFIYTPSLNYTGADMFGYRVSDGLLTSATTPVRITVIPVNDPPTAGVLGDSYSLLEDATLTVPAAGVLANDGDVDGDPLTAVLVSGVAHGTLALNSNGSFSYTPAANYFGPDSFTYVASDGLTSSAPAVVSITVLPVNDVPSFANAGNQRVNMNAPAQSVNWASNISTGPTNESSQTLAFLVSNDNAALFSAPPALAPNGTLTYTPAANAFGTANVRVRLQDNGGTANGGVDTSAEIVFAIVVNSPPAVSIVSPANGVALLFPATFSVISSPSDPDGTVTNVQFLLNGTNFLSVAEAPFYYVMSNAAPGSYQLRAIASDNFGLTATSAVVNVDVITNFVIATGPILLNHQNGLFEQFVTVSNRTSETWANGVRLFVQNLDTTNRVWNPTGTNAGVPYLDQSVSMPPGGSTVITVQYYVPNPRTTPNPTLVATPRPFSTPPVVPRLTRIRRAGEGFEIQFTTQSGRFYFVQSSEDLIRWTTQPTPIAGTGGVVASPQGSVAHRFFRVLLVP